MSVRVSFLIQHSYKPRKIEKWITGRVDCFHLLLKVNLPLNHPTAETLLGRGSVDLYVSLLQFVLAISTDHNPVKKVLRLGRGNLHLSMMLLLVCFDKTSQDRQV